MRCLGDSVHEPDIVRKPIRAVPVQGVGELRSHSRSRDSKARRLHLRALCVLRGCDFSLTRPQRPVWRIDQARTRESAESFPSCVLLPARPLIYPGT